MEHVTVKEGNYAQPGAVCHEDRVIFTFRGEKEDECKIVLVSGTDGKETRIAVPNEYCLGSLRSVALSGFCAEDYWYYYEINGQRVIDPYARKIEGRQIWNDAARSKNGYAVYCGIKKQRTEWEVEPAPEVAKQDMIIYKLHVRGFSMNGGAPKKTAGTFAAVRDRIPYLKELGATTIELMPVYEFEEIIRPEVKKAPDYINWQEKAGDKIRPVMEQETQTRVNYWGYGPGDYFAVKASYACDPERAEDEFLSLVKELHANGMECVLEFYFPEQEDHNRIRDALRYWVRMFHIDGFHLLGTNLPVTAIVQDVLLSRTKLFYTDFDDNLRNLKKNYRNLYLYRDEYLYPARKLLNHADGSLTEFLNQQRKQDTNVGYVNYITSNNGFTLADLFMYNERHNEDNGENNTDGSAWNYSNNYGIEGPSRKHFITGLRRRQWRNAMMMLLLSQGVPLLWEGDEILNSQCGNNNAYCQDNPTGWVNWRGAKTHEKDLEFVKRLCAFRKAHPIISQEEPFRFSDYRSLGCPDLSYHGEKAWISGFDPGRKSVGVMYNGAYQGEKAESVYVAYNFSAAVVTLALPKLERNKKWYQVADTAADEGFSETAAMYGNQQSVRLAPQSVSILIGK